MNRLLVSGVAVLALACGSDPTSPDSPTPQDNPILMGAGDIGQCGSAGAANTGKLLDAQTGTIFAAGDLAYPDGSAQQFLDCYEPVWGRHKDRTYPAPGNHEYGSIAAAPYFAYFGSRAGPAGLGYYRYSKGPWQVFSLNSNLDGPAATAQIDWLKGQLGASGDCSIAYFHHPRFSSGPHGALPPAAAVPEIWRQLYSAGADIVISAHEHFYERFAPQNADGVPDGVTGIRQFIVGTGGAELTRPIRRVANSEITMSVYGVLRLSLDNQSYRWDFLSADSGASLDSGSGSCHGRPR
jgi:Calcineurin-like phosphoesterase